MTRSEEELTRDENIDQRVLMECIKNDLFPKAKFVLGSDGWDVGGMICKDCMKCCRGRIGLQTMTEAERERHMEKIWMRGRRRPWFRKEQVLCARWCRTSSQACRRVKEWGWKNEDCF
jgi:hypothetical protein